MRVRSGPFSRAWAIHWHGLRCSTRQGALRASLPAAGGEVPVGGSGRPGAADAGDAHAAGAHDRRAWYGSTSSRAPQVVLVHVSI